MVAVHDDGRPALVPPLTVETPVEKRRYAAAEVRRTLRREFSARLEQVAEQARDPGAAAK